jgi:hypothetical protein
MSLEVRGHTLAQLVDALLHNSEIAGSVPDSLRPHYSTGVDSASIKNWVPEYLLEVKGSRCLGLTNLPPLCADCLPIWAAFLCGYPLLRLYLLPAKNAQLYAVLSWYMCSGAPPSCNSCYVCTVMRIPIIVRHNKIR